MNSVKSPPHPQRRRMNEAMEASDDSDEKYMSPGRTNPSGPAVNCPFINPIRLSAKNLLIPLLSIRRAYGWPGYQDAYVDNPPDLVNYMTASLPPTSGRSRT